MEWLDEMSPLTLFMLLFSMLAVVYMIYYPPGVKTPKRKTEEAFQEDKSMSANLNMLRISFQALAPTLESISNSLKEIAINTKPS
jgi:Na+/H+ antiporter NhaD/arsenite permease-like protein